MCNRQLLALLLCLRTTSTAPAAEFECPCEGDPSLCQPLSRAAAKVALPNRTVIGSGLLTLIDHNRP